MCLPAVPLLIASTVLSAVGAGVSAYSQSQSSKYQGRVADQNAAMEAQAANEAQQATRESALAHYRRVGQLKGQQRAAMAANGLDTDFGTSGMIADDTSMLAQEDARRLYKQGDNEVRGFDISSANFRSQAAASRQAATGSLINGAFDIGGSILSGAQQYGKLKPVKPKLKYDWAGL